MGEFTISVTLDSLVSEQIKDILFLKEHGLKDDLKPFIFPYLLNENERLCVEEEPFPDIPVSNWNGFKVTYILNWNIRFNFITTWDPLTIYKMGQLGIKNEEAFCCSLCELPTDDYVGCGFCEAVKRLDGRSLAHDPL